MNVTRRGFLNNLTLLSAGAFCMPALSGAFSAEGKPWIVGIGRSGGRIVLSCMRQAIDARFLIIEDDFNTGSGQGYQRAWFNYSGMDRYDGYELGNIVYCFANFERVYGEMDRIILVNGIGGKFGTTIGRKFFNDLHESGKKFYWITSFPFDFEGTRRMERANDFMRDIQYFSNFVCFYNESIRHQYDIINRSDVFKVSDQVFLQKIKTIVNTIFL